MSDAEAQDRAARAVAEFEAEAEGHPWFYDFPTHYVEILTHPEATPVVAHVRRVGTFWAVGTTRDFPITNSQYYIERVCT